MSTTNVLLDHNDAILSSIDPSVIDIHASGAHSGTSDHTILLAQEVEGVYESAGVQFDELADSNAQNILRKLGFVIILVQLVSLVFKGMSGNGGNLAMAYGGAGGGLVTRLGCTVIAVFMLTDIKVIPPIVDMIQEGIVNLGNWLFKQGEGSGGAAYDDFGVGDY